MAHETASPSKQIADCATQILGLLYLHGLSITQVRDVLDEAGKRLDDQVYRVINTIALASPTATARTTSVTP